ncbi:glycerol-3-phosphate 1-O-acyltransferase PlsB [Halopseudomonas pelagia]|uniref:Glycerol-3-phosphate acyltransferase n=1 Tax=Halopseudomonas pelagia TaxID=553151 RepID=A0AA92IHS0_9GAMM|nr:glycerol-3-phosphate 1-O-acyltransferase PlsB [Halopseudomonas pelagia]PCC98105.1 glycerol-3-phosphate 1-O-acyltransferase [Halopseudomonas pelagia]QFY56029.1 glycerol-3-phosphate 1-O-acyltransferase PlsB [Halopseudomonas pelagia]
MPAVYSSFFGRLRFGLLRRLLYLWARSDSIGNAAFDLHLDRDTPIIYVLPYRSLSDLIVLDRECRKAGLPRPVRAPVGGLGEQESYAFLSKEQAWVGRPDPRGQSPRLLRAISAVEERQREEVQLVPVSVFWGQSPDVESSPIKLLFAYNWAVGGRMRKLLAILLHGRKIRVRFGEALSLKELVGEQLGHERHVRRTGRLLRVYFRQQRGAVVGPDLSHRRTLLKGLLQSPMVRAAIEKEALEKGVDPTKARKDAARYANEIASDFTYSIIRFMEVVLSWFWNKLYDGIRINHIERVQRIARGNEIIYVPCHRSHIDYLLLSYILFQNSLTPPHIAAGINLNMPVIGGILRRGGAFFMRRTFKGNQLYTAVFNEYLHTLFSRGFPVEYFIEGGRSRTGRTLNPKTGMLAITLRSYLRSSRRPIVFVPVYVGYERVLEGRTYLGELRGQEKKKESFFDIFRVLSALKLRFGKVAVNFGEPVSLNGFLEQQQPGWRQRDYAPDYRPEWLSETTKQLARSLANAINAAADANPVNMVALAMLSTSRLALDEPALKRVLNTYKSLLSRVPYSPSMTLPDMDGQAMIEYVEGMQFMGRQSDALGEILFLDEPQAVLMTYYRNNVLHLVALPALIACLFLNNPRMSREQIDKLVSAIYPYLQGELFLQWQDAELPGVISTWIDGLIAEGLLREEAGQIKRPDPSSSEFVLLSLLARSILQMLERFYMAAALLLNNPNGSLTAEELETLCTVMAQRLSILHGLNAPEFFDKTLFRQFIQRLNDLQVIRTDSEGRLQYLPGLEDIAENTAKRVLSAEIRLSIRQVARSSNTAPIAPVEPA